MQTLLQTVTKELQRIDVTPCFELPPKLRKGIHSLHTPKRFWQARTSCFWGICFKQGAYWNEVWKFPVFSWNFMVRNPWLTHNGTQLHRACLMLFLCFNTDISDSWQSAGVVSHHFTLPLKSLHPLQKYFCWLLLLSASFKRFIQRTSSGYTRHQRVKIDDKHKYCHKVTFSWNPVKRIQGTAKSRSIFCFSAQIFMFDINDACEPAPFSK